MSSIPRTLNLEVENETRRKPSLAPFRRIARRAGKLWRLPKRTSVALALVTNSRMQELNRRTRGVNRATDVLSFPLHHRRLLNRVPKDPDGVYRLGDIVLALGVAQRQAREREVPLQRELSELFAHGLLHLLGYDHQTTADARRMAVLAARLVGRR